MVIVNHKETVVKKTIIPPLTFKDEGEVKEFERKIRQAHSQFVDEEALPKEDPDPLWPKRKAPGILKKIIPTLLPPRSHHRKLKS